MAGKQFVKRRINPSLTIGLRYLVRKQMGRASEPIIWGSKRILALAADLSSVFIVVVGRVLRRLTRCRQF